MPKAAAITVRIPGALRERIEARAEREQRSLSAQITFELLCAFEQEAPRTSGKRLRFLGRFEGARVPTDADFREVRRLWSRSARSDG